MNVGIEGSCWGNRRGYGRHLRSLVCALAGNSLQNRYTLVTDFDVDPTQVPPGVSVRVVPSSTPAAVAASAVGRRTLRDMWNMSRALSTGGFDVLLFPTVYSYVPVFGRALRVVTIHDVIAETYPHLTVPGFAARSAWRLKVAIARMQANVVVTVSEYSRRLLIDRFGLDPESVFVAGEAPDGSFRRLDLPVVGERLRRIGFHHDERIVVYVGGFSPHKNLEALLRAFAKASPPTVKLVMVGDYERDVFLSYFGTIQCLATSLGLAGRVVFTGFLADDDLAALLNHAEALVLPSFMEGFGLPAVEAAACGCPVIATRESPLPELLGQGGIFVNPAEADIASALSEVLDSAQRRASMREAGLAAASRLTWSQAASQMASIIESAKREKRR